MLAHLHYVGTFTLVNVGKTEVFDVGGGGGTDGQREERRVVSSRSTRALTDRPLVYDHEP